MASKYPEVNAAILQAFNRPIPPLNYEARQKMAERDRATMEYLVRLREGQLQTQWELRGERYKG